MYTQVRLFQEAPPCLNRHFLGSKWPVAELGRGRMTLGCLTTFPQRSFQVTDITFNRSIP